MTDRSNHLWSPLLTAGRSARSVQALIEIMVYGHAEWNALLRTII